MTPHTDTPFHKLADYVGMTDVGLALAFVAITLGVVFGLLAGFGWLAARAEANGKDGMP